MTIAATDTVEYDQPLAHEVGLTFTVIEMRGDRCLIEANVDMPIRPQTVAFVSDLRKVEA